MKENKTKNENRIKIICTVEAIKYYKNDYGILQVSLDKTERGEVITDRNNCLIIKGEMPKPTIGESYRVSALYENDPKWGEQYKVEIMTASVVLDDKDKQGQRKFLEALFTQKQIDNMYAALDDPFTALKNKDMQALVKIKGCGIYTATTWTERFQLHFHLAKIYAELEDYNLSVSIIKRLIERYKSPELVIEKVKSNPYILVTEVKGIGWVTADRIALAGGVGEYDPKRISAFIYQYLDEQADEGYSWITPDELLGVILENFGEEIPDSAITEGIHYIDGKLWWNEDKSKLGLKWIYELELKIANEIIRLRDAESKLNYDGWQDAVKKIEALQGWEYTDEQISGIQKALESNVILIQGSGGTGKTSIVGAVIEALHGCSFAQCALSGKAASRLMEVTHKEGYTIHRLLGYPKGPTEKSQYEYNDENPLSLDLIILDEVSMVNLSLFYYLLRAIPSGAKLICLGDNGQLEAIGSGNIAFDLLHSEEIESVVLTKIHRQAAESAIITESLKIRNGQQIVLKEWVGHEVRGKLQDFDLLCYSDRSNTFYKMMQTFNELLNKKIPISDIQLIIPNKVRGDACTYNLNNAVQEVYNPNGKVVTTCYAGKGMPYELRIGDKVVNSVNNYKTSPNIYNGNIGMIKRVEDEEYGLAMIIDFEGIGEVAVPEDYWKNIELAYALTCHRMQGSESRFAIFGLDYNAFSLLSKELVYTGITRAKEKCYLIAETSALRYATSKSSVKIKQTHLQQLLYEVTHPKLIF